MKGGQHEKRLKKLSCNHGTQQFGYTPDGFQALPMFNQSDLFKHPLDKLDIFPTRTAIEPFHNIFNFDE